MLGKSILKIGDKLPDFTLIATNGRECNLYEFEESKIIVVMFTCNHCPYVQAYEERLIGLQKEFASEGVTLVAINSNDEKDYPEDSFENMVKRSNKMNYNFPYLRDDTQEVAKMFGVTYTPEVFVFDQDRILRYHGGIDDNWKDPSKVKKENLKEAIKELLAGKKPSIYETSAIGCTIKWVKN
ncbi:MAG: thioredoxin family protein [Candidatus Melainabacteria bacterium]|nr:thioredoxin family protein [Candidatus Melainabacteria bacterium]